jgi:hypothetical protein
VRVSKRAHVHFSSMYRSSLRLRVWKRVRHFFAPHLQKSPSKILFLASAPSLLFHMIIKLGFLNLQPV